MSRLYIAYGSNLSKRQMRIRCPTARPLGKFLFKDARLIFRGVADLEYHKGAVTPCGLWVINKDDEASLDAYEGIHTGAYFKTTEIEINYAGVRRKPVIYLMNHDGGVYPPSQAYVDVIRQGYRDFKLDERYLDEAIRRSFVDKNADDHMIARRMRQRTTEKHFKLVDVPFSLRQGGG